MCLIAPMLILTATLSAALPIGEPAARVTPQPASPRVTLRARARIVTAARPADDARRDGAQGAPAFQIAQTERDGATLVIASYF